MICRLASRLAICLILIPGLAAARAARGPAPAAQSPPPAPLTPPAMCEAGITGAEGNAGLPARVLHAIAMRESGRLDPDTRRVRPWPWTINFEGIGHYYASKEEAIAAVQQIQATGAQSVDVGCMQVNLMHHPRAFATLDEAFDPSRNAAYAGRFLRSLFAATGDWGMAIAGYHSRTPGIGDLYRDQVVARWNPTDPAVLAKLTTQPLPALPGPLAGASPSRLPAIYMPFAQPGPIQISANMAYRAFLPASSAYRSFAPTNAVYADFARKPIKAARGRPLDLSINSSLSGSGRALVVPKGVIERGVMKPSAVRAARAAGRSG